MSYLVFDIETYKSDRAEEYFEQKDFPADARLKDPEKIEADIAKKRASAMERAALSPITGRVTCIGASVDGNYRFFSHIDERVLLEDFATFIEGKIIHYYVSKNGYDFDIPFLRVRYMANKLPMPIWLQPLSRGKHIDIKNYFGRGAMGINGPSLKDLEFVLDIRRDGEKDALQCFDWWENGDIESLEKYNEQDVRSTESIYLMVERP